MRLSADMILFTDCLGKLLTFLAMNEIHAAIGEVQRDIERQAKLFNSGASKTMKSRHLVRCAADIDLYENGELLTKGDHPLYKRAGEFWESLNPRCAWGGRWTFVDGRHFELKEA